MMKRKRSHHRKKPARKRLATSSPLQADTTQVVVDIVHTLEEKQFGTKLRKKNHSRTYDKSRTKGK
jgi:hypothetical protein